ncbi:MgtC/SapB family protein [Gulosibacter chungangensis]|uniref:MgtC/SapB family protein n=1 Tax=Gulosibacter chungangensis TaxID=979746 RepID=A0A7J5BB77_9MICO|nr:MgtC/SapB family protein [Gulosibacter chungangensis]KAB1643392.1 MgtC/SapB family protein [Gulosibacter chungangensis]
MEFVLFDDSTLSQIVLLLIAFVFAAVIGIEREFRHKSAGARTHILVGVGAALFTLVSVYGFSGMTTGDPPQDPARIAAQVVTGIGFLGAGVIFVRQSVVAGLTTAASIWVTASIGMACGAGMPVIAGIAVLLYLLSVTLMTVVVRKIREPHRERTLRFEYFDGQGILRTILAAASGLGYTASLHSTARIPGREHTIVEATMTFRLLRPMGQGELVETLTELPGVLAIEVLTDEESDEANRE